MMSLAQGLFAGVNRVQDSANLTDLEKKHLPVITAPDQVAVGAEFEVTVEVGQLLAHPNERGHFIQFIELHVGDVYLSRLSLTAETTLPIFRVRVRLPRDLGPLRACASCNLHGTWEGTKPIRVTAA